MAFLNTIVKSRSTNGTDIFFQPDESKVIIGLDVRTWLSSTAYENSEQYTQVMARNEKTCSLCLESIVPEDKLSTFLCGHALHFECANSWISNCIQNYRPAPCPLCNYIIISPVLKFVPNIEEAVGTEEVIINEGEVDNTGSARFIESRIRSFRKKISWFWTLKRS